MARGKKRKGVPCARICSEERDEGKEKQTYKVRCAVTYVHYAFVEAHDSEEAELLAE